MRKFKKVLSLLLGLMLCVLLIPPTAIAEEIELNFMYVGGWSEMDDDNTSIIVDKIAEKTGVRMTFTNITGDREQIILASGDTTDCLMIYKQTDISTAIEGGLMLPLKDMIAEKAPNLLAMTDRLQMAGEMLSDGSGEIYFLPVQCGSEGAPSSPYHSLFMTRWDLYKEMGFPEVTDLDSMIACLVKMQQAYPVTEEGLPVYGYSLAITGIESICFPDIYGTFGYYPSNQFISTNINTGEMEYHPTDENSPFWQACEFYNKVYKAGLLDPDSFTQKAEDRNAKVSAGQVLAPVFFGSECKVFESNALATDPASIKGFQVLPVTGTTYWCNSYYKGGWDACFVGIPKTSKNPDAVLKVLDYLATEEGCRLINSGIEGVHWNYIDGIPTLTDEIIELSTQGNDEWKKLGLHDANFTCLAGWGPGEICSDGYPMDLFMTKQVYQQGNIPTDNDYCEYYNVSYPMELFLNLMEEGLIHDHINDVFDMRVVTGLGSAPEDIARVDAKISNMGLELVPELVMADDFEAAKANAIAAFNKNGAETAREYWQNRHDTLTEMFVVK